MNLSRLFPLALLLLAGSSYAISPGAATPCAEEASPSAAVEGTVNNLSCDPTTRALRVSGSFSPSGTGDVNLKQIGGSTTAQGHGTAAAALRVELPTDGTGLVNSAQSGTWNVTNISGTITLPTGAATDASLTNGNLKSTAGVELLDSGGTNKASISSAGALSANTAQVNGVTTSTGAGATGTGTQRVGVAQDTTTIAGSAPGTAGSASSNVVTVQGVASMTKLLVTPDANSAVNVAQMNGVATSMGAGNTDTGTQRVVVATNQGAVNVSPDNVLDGANASCSAASATTLTCTGISSPIPTLGYGSVQIDVQTMSATSITPQAYFDGGTTVRTVRCKSVSNTALTDVVSITATGAYECEPGDHFQLTQVGAGSTLVKVALKRVSGPSPAIPVMVSGSTNSSATLLVGGYDGSVVRRFTTDTSGNQKVDLLGNAAAIMDAATGAAVPANALMAGFSDGTNAQFAKVSADKAVMTTPVSPASGNILDGYQSFTSTTGATTLITITAGKTWIGQLVANASVDEAAAGAVQAKALVIFTTAGANITPAAGTYFACQATAGANAATGVVGSENSNFCTTPFTAICASGTCTIQVTTTQAGTNSRIDTSAIGNMQ